MSSACPAMQMRVGGNWRRRSAAMGAIFFFFSSCPLCDVFNLAYRPSVCVELMRKRAGTETKLKLHHCLVGRGKEETGCLLGLERRMPMINGHQLVSSLENLQFSLFRYDDGPFLWRQKDSTTHHLEKDKMSYASCARQNPVDLLSPVCHWCISLSSLKLLFLFILALRGVSPPSSRITHGILAQLYLMVSAQLFPLCFASAGISPSGQSGFFLSTSDW